MALLGPALDKITLNTLDYYIRGPVQGDALSEFEDGFKIGKATYDTRENAFFLVLDDFSEGFGHRRLDIHEDIGAYWDSNRDNSPNLARKGHVTLGYPQGVITPASQPTTVNMTKRNPSMPSWFMPDSAYCVGFGNKIYKTGDGLTFALVGTAGADACELQSFVEYIENNGTITHFAFFASATEATTGTARYMKSTDNGNTWVNGVKNYVLHDGIFWDNKIIASFGRSIIFGVVTAGVETWNVDVVTDGQPVGAVSHGHIHYLGVAEAPFGQPSVFFTDEADMWVSDFYARKCYRIDTGLAGHYITASCQWRGNFYLSDGWNVMEYDTSARTMKNIGFPRMDGLPPTMRTTTGDWTITALGPSEGTLFAGVCLNGSAPKSALFQYVGKGWSQVSNSQPGFCHAVMQINLRNTFLTTTRNYYLLMSTGATDLAFFMSHFNLPGEGHIPVVGVDSFNATGEFTTGWIDGGFLDIYGNLLRLNCDAFNLTTTETIKVEYQLDNNETGSWTQMVNASNAATNFNSSNIVLYFSATDPKLGIQFRTVRFRITLLRTGGDTTLSPELRGLSLVYFKKPPLRMGWKFSIDISRMYQDNPGLTFANILSGVTTAWNNEPLVYFSIPNVVTNARVMLNHIVVKVDNIRSSETEPVTGTIEVSLLEPIS